MRRDAEVLAIDLGKYRPTFSRNVGPVTARRLNDDIGIACSTRNLDADPAADGVTDIRPCCRGETTR